MKIITNIILFIAILLIIFIPYLASEFEIHKANSGANVEKMINSCVDSQLFGINKPTREQCETLARESIQSAESLYDQLSFGTKVKLGLNSSFIYWHLWLLPLALIFWAYFTERRKNS